MNESKPKRRWFQFSLRTLFVMVTIFGLGLAYEYKWQKDRHEMLAHGLGTAVAPNVVFTGQLFGVPPWYLRLFTNEGCREIWLIAQVNVNPAEQEQAISKMKSLFPEARVRIVNR